jgi:hypothetical protein
VLENAWTQLLPGEYPAVVIAGVVGQSNPFTVRSMSLAPLVVMCEGLPAFIFSAVLTAMPYAHEEADAEECLTTLPVLRVVVDPTARTAPCERHDSASQHGESGDHDIRRRVIELRLQLGVLP